MTELQRAPMPATPLTPAVHDVQPLRAALRGDVVAPGDTAYEAERLVWNGMIDRRPAAIARCLGVSDVVAALRFARAHGLPVAMRGGGHNIAGLAVADGALVIDFSRMRGVSVDPVQRVARAQAGCLLSDVDRETQLHGLAAVLGFVSTTGIAGLTLGGGFGYLTRRFGWTCDTVRSMEMVTADGEVVRASAREHPELFWALRGGGGNFGVVTEIEYELFPVGPEVLGGGLAWRAEDAPAVLEAWRALLAEAPREMTCVAALRIAPPAPWIDATVHGQPIVALFVCHTGPIAAGEALVERLRRVAPPVGDTVQRRSYTSQQALLDATQPKGRRYYWKSEYLPAVDAAMVAPLIAQASRLPSPHSAILVFPLGDAMAERSDDDSAVGNRDARFVINIAAAWDGASGDGASIAWARAAWEALRGFGTGGSYINFQTDDEGEERLRSAYPRTLARLAEVKRQWDPGNVFRLNRNIAPAG